MASELCSLLRPLIVEPVFEVAAVDSPFAPELDSREGALTELAGDDKRRYAHVFADIGDRQPLLGRVDGNSPHLASCTRSSRPSKGPAPPDPRLGIRSSQPMLLTMSTWTGPRSIPTSAQLRQPVRRPTRRGGRGSLRFGPTRWWCLPSCRDSCSESSTSSLRHTCSPMAGKSGSSPASC